MRFLKMHGAGNDFIVLDRRGTAPPMTESLARALGDRHMGVGYDQIVEITGETAHPTLTFWNSDGSLSGACGNATRCVAALILDETGQDALSLHTARGELRAVRDEDQTIRVNMGQPQLEWAEVPLSAPVETLHLPIAGDPAACGMGNPHCVFFVPDADAVALAERGAEMEHHPLFPQATNVEFAEIRDPSTIRMRVWERGAGVTLACGSGACAVAVSAQRRGLTRGPVRILADGGELGVDWREDGVWLSGPTALVFEGVLSPGFLEAHA